MLIMESLEKRITRKIVTGIAGISLLSIAASSFIAQKAYCQTKEEIDVPKVHSSETSKEKIVKTLIEGEIIFREIKSFVPEENPNMQARWSKIWVKDKEDERTYSLIGPGEIVDLWDINEKKVDYRQKADYKLYGRFQFEPLKYGEFTYKTYLRWMYGEDEENYSKEIKELLEKHKTAKSIDRARGLIKSMSISKEWKDGTIRSFRWDSP